MRHLKNYLKVSLYYVIYKQQLVPFFVKLHLHMLPPIKKEKNN